MKTAKKLLSVVLAVAILATTLVFSLTTSAATDPDAMVITSTNAYGPNSYGIGGTSLNILGVDGSFYYQEKPDKAIDEKTDSEYRVYDKGWNTNHPTSHATLSYADRLENAAASKFSVKMTCEHNEGFKATVKNYPIFSSVSVWCPIEGAKAVMLRVKVPKGTDSTTSIRIAMGTSNAWGNGNSTMYPGSNTAEYWYIANNSSSWVKGGTAPNQTYGAVQLTLPSGFDGHIALALPEGATSVEGMQIGTMEFILGTLGPDYGDFYYGGISTLAELPVVGENNTTATFNGETEPLCNYTGTVEYGYQWAPSVTDTTVQTFVDNHHGFAGENAIKISAASDTGARVNNPIVAYIPAERSMNGVTHIMTYVEIPENAKNDAYNIRLLIHGGEGGFRFRDAAGTVYKGDYDSGEYSYLALDGTEWVTDTLSADSQFKTSVIKNGFKGYLKFDVTKITWSGTAPTDVNSLVLDDIGFTLASYGPTYGDYYFGGVYMLSADYDSRFARLGADGEKMALNFVRDNTNIAYRTYGTTALTEETATAITVNDPGYGKILASTTGIALRNKGWGSRTSYATMTFNDFAAIGYNRSITISSTIDEGYGLANSIHTFILDSTTTYMKYTTQNTWTRDEIGGQARYVMFYLETPENGDTSAIRLLVSGDQSGGYSGGINSAPYTYLDTSASEWSEWGTTGDQYGDISLPAGFKGYVVVDAANLLNEFADFRIQSVEIRFGKFGPSYGSYTYGGYWTLTNFSTDNIYFKTNRVAWTSTPSITDTWEGYMTDNRAKEIYYHGDVNKSFDVDICDLVALNNADADYYYVDADMVLDGEIKDNDIAVLRKCLIGAMNIADLKNADLADVINFEDAVSAISEANVATAAQLDSATAAYMALSDEQQTFVSTDKVARLNTLNAALTDVRPTMLGFSCRDNGATAQALKIGTDCNVTAPEGYTVTGYGTVAISAANFNTADLLTVDTQGATVTSVAATDAKGQISAVYSFADKTKYLDDILTRSYVEYSDGENTYKVYNNIYKYSDDVEDLCMSARMIDVANHFNVSIFQKLAAAVSDILSA
ncbi:MAG: hypothetical protein J6B93_02660 [Clostridia bacterium]|nr:hypothetical protein [Clostridia bacterium]